MESTKRGQMRMQRNFPRIFQRRCQDSPGVRPSSGAESLPVRKVRNSPAVSPVRTILRSRTGALLCLVLLLALTFVTPTRAAVRFDMFTGYDGIVPQGSWFPIAFEVQNDGPPFVAVVEVSPGQFNSTQTRTMVVELPTGTTKRFVMPTFNAASYNPTWNARLLDERGKVRAEAIGQRVRRLNNAALPLAAAMTRATPPLPEIKDAKNRQEDLRPVFGRLQPSVFPDNPLVLEGLDVLYLSSERILELKVNQVGPILAWLYGGGHLVISLEQLNHLSGPGVWLKQILPIDPGAMTSVASQGELQKWLEQRARYDGSDFKPVSTRSPKTTTTSSVNPYANLSADSQFEGSQIQVMTGKLKDGRVLVGSQTSPLIVTAKRGRGQITALTFAPELEPFRAWKNADFFWAKMIDLPPELFSTDFQPGYSGRPIDGIFGAMIDSKQIRKLPVGWLLLLLVGYLVVIGPLDQYWLKKLNRQMLTWLTFPAYVAFFSLLIYFIGYKLRAGETEWNELHIVDIIPHGDTADLRGRIYGSIYSPVNARYNFAGDQTFSTLRGEFSGNYGGGQESSRANIEQRANGFLAQAAVPVWTSQLFVSDWWRQDAAPVRVTVTGKDIVIDNDLEVNLTEVKLVLKDRVIDLGAVPAQEKKTFPRQGPSSISLSEFLSTHSQNFAGAIESRQRAFGNNQQGQIRDLTNAVIAASFVTQLNTPNNYQNFSSPPGFDLSRLNDRGDAILFAWAPDYSFTKPLNQFPTRRGTRTTLIRVSCEVQP